ncbi:MAG: hypothetical protein ACTH9H_12945, partial [Galactobacter sp.]
MCHNRACVNVDHLRVVTNKQNSENRSDSQKNNTSGFRGVTKSRPSSNKWIAQVRHRGRRIYLGTFADIAEAAAAARLKRVELFTHNDIDREAS